MGGLGVGERGVRGGLQPKVATQPRSQMLGMY